ncbi:MAG: cytochrome c biogenesis protein CcsA [Gammaproteobacteria bacterium]|nr:cytochrome c biogenesis protein CcsA [Gammaproteobacteria bacterium]
MYSIVLGSAAAVLYILTGTLLGVRLSQAGSGRRWNKSGLLALGTGAALLHASVLIPALLHPEGINLGFFNALSLTGWLIAVVLLLASWFRPVETLGIILLPFSGITVLTQLAFPSERIVGDSTQWPLEVHILISILAYSILTLAAVQAILLAVQDRRLRNRQPGGFVRGIPPLVTMESLLFQMIGIGFVLLGLALLSGWMFLEDIFAQHLVHKTVLSLVAWAVFGILLWGRWRFGWRGRKAIRWTLGGFVTLALAYFGSKMVLELVLHR